MCDAKRRKLVLVEVKDFEIARTPAELKNEVDKLLVGSSSATEKHVKRMEWMEQNIAHVLDFLEVETSPKSRSKWRVEGVIVTSSALLSPLLLRKPRLPVLSIDGLLNHLRTKKQRSGKRG